MHFGDGGICKFVAWFSEAINGTTRDDGSILVHSGSVIWETGSVKLCQSYGRPVNVPISVRHLHFWIEVGADLVKFVPISVMALWLILEVYGFRVV